MLILHQAILSYHRDKKCRDPRWPRQILDKLRFCLVQKIVLNNHREAEVFLLSTKVVSYSLCLSAFSYIIKFIKDVLVHLVR